MINQWQVGDRVLADWGDGYWYIATVEAAKGPFVTILRSDGVEEYSTADCLVSAEIEPEIRIEIRRQQSDEYYTGTLLQKDGDKVQIAYDGKSPEWTTIDRVRWHPGLPQKKSSEWLNQAKLAAKAVWGLGAGNA